MELTAAQLDAREQAAKRQHRAQDEARACLSQARNVEILGKMGDDKRLATMAYLRDSIKMSGDEVAGRILLEVSFPESLSTVQEREAMRIATAVSDGYDPKADLLKRYQDEQDGRLKAWLRDVVHSVRTKLAGRTE